MMPWGVWLPPTTGKEDDAPGTVLLPTAGKEDDAPGTVLLPMAGAKPPTAGAATAAPPPTAGWIAATSLMAAFILKVYCGFFIAGDATCQCDIKVLWVPLQERKQAVLPQHGLQLLPNGCGDSALCGLILRVDTKAAQNLQNCFVAANGWLNWPSCCWWRSNGLHGCQRLAGTDLRDLPCQTLLGATHLLAELDGLGAKIVYVDPALHEATRGQPDPAGS